MHFFLILGSLDSCRGSPNRDPTGYAVAEYWLANPKAATLETLRLKDGQMAATGYYGRSDTCTTPLLPGLSVDLRKIF